MCRRTRGLTLVETVIAVAIFSLVALMLYETYSRVFITVRAAQARLNAVELANEQFEIVNNLAYADVGVVGGIPAGKLPPVKVLVRAGMTYLATTTVRNVDQPFDGVIGGTPNDLSPADNKLVEIDITCVTCPSFRPMRLTTTVAPRDLEGASTNGSLFVRALDAAGLPVSGAMVHVFNNEGTTTININDITSTSGMLQIVDAPPGAEAYQITVTKPGYSTERTYSTLGPTTTSPTKPHATVLVQNVTQLSFAIDRLATLNFSGVSPSCASVPGVGVSLLGSKLIGTVPSLPKHSAWYSLGASGKYTATDIEWDTYTIEASSTAHDLAGVMPLSPAAIAPGATQEVQLIMVPKDPPSVLVTVRDNATGLPVSGAVVTLSMGSDTFTQTTGRGFLSQTDWAGGNGQETMGASDRYATDDSGVDVSTTPGEVLLRDTLGLYTPSGELVSSVFDTGSVSNFYQFTHLPVVQPLAVGNDGVQFQIATGNSTSSWTYLGPDGTAGTYYTATATDIAAIHGGDRYLRYKAILSTASSTATPNLAEVQFTFTSACVPPGQVLFQGLATGTWDVAVTKSGYTNYVGTVVVTPGSWQEKTTSLVP